MPKKLIQDVIPKTERRAKVLTMEAQPFHDKKTVSREENPPEESPIKNKSVSTVAIKRERVTAPTNQHTPENKSPVKVTSFLAIFQSPLFADNCNLSFTCKTERGDSVKA